MHTRRVILSLSLAFGVLAASRAGAQISAGLSQAELVMARRSQVTLAINMTNRGSGEVFLNGDSVNSNVPGVTVSSGSFLGNAPDSLKPSGIPGASWAGDAVSIEVSADAAPGIYAGTYEITGGPDLAAQKTIVKLPFRVTVLQDTAPTTAAALSGPVGSNGWYKGPVTVTLTATDPDGPNDVAAIHYTLDGGSEQTYSGPFTVSGDGTHSGTFWSVDQAGHVESPRGAGSFRIDATGPTLTWGSQTPAASGAGWNNAAVDIPFTVADSLSGVDTVSSVSPLHFADEGKGQTQTVTVTDRAGNSATFTSPAVNIDWTPPTITVPSPALNVTATSATATSVSYAPTAADSLSGVVGSVVCKPASGSSFSLGSSTVNCTAQDAAGNAAAASFQVNVTYSWSGVLQPINTDGSSVFKLGSAVPVKFQLTGASIGIKDAVANLSYTRIGDANGAINEGDSQSAADTGSQFRYDPVAGQYVFVMSTKGLTAGKYSLIIDLHDGVSRSVVIALK